MSEREPVPPQGHPRGRGRPPPTGPGLQPSVGTHPAAGCRLAVVCPFSEGPARCAPRAPERAWFPPQVTHPTPRPLPAAPWAWARRPRPSRVSGAPSFVLRPVASALPSTLIRSSDLRSPVPAAASRGAEASAGPGDGAQAGDRACGCPQLHPPLVPRGCASPPDGTWSAWTSRCAAASPPPAGTAAAPGQTSGRPPGRKEGQVQVSSLPQSREFLSQEMVWNFRPLCLMEGLC